MLIALIAAIAVVVALAWHQATIDGLAGQRPWEG
jgi:hypothetical protein